MADLLFSVLARGVIEIGKCICGSMYPKMKTIIRFHKKFDNLTEEMKTLLVLKDDVKERVEEAERDGYLLKSEVVAWLKKVEDIEKELVAMQCKVDISDDNPCQCCPDCCLRSSIAAEMVTMVKEVQRLMEVGQFPSGLVLDNYQVKRVELMPGPSIECLSTAMKNLSKILKLLEDANVCKIGVWGMGGIGKTYLVKNLNNKLLADSSAQSFSIVIWATASKKLNIRVLQTQIAARLNMTIKNGESLERTASQLHQRLVRQKKFLLILDDVWEPIDLDALGIPQLNDMKGSKVILTTRSFDVCRQMSTDAEVKVDNLNEEESWLLFTQKAGEVTGQIQIQPLAKAVTKECDGLPLAIIIAGSSMRGKAKVELWKDALKAFQRSVPHNKVIEDKVYKVVKWSYDAIESTGTKLSERKLSRMKQGNKKGMDIETCFLYCSLYPEDFAIKIQDLVQLWIAEGLLDDLLNYEDSFNRAITLVENLKDACLLEDGVLEGTVQMHDVIRDVAIWIASSLKDEHMSLVQSGYSVTQISDIEFPNSVKRISLMYNNIENLPDTMAPCPDASTLLLQGNLPLQCLPEGFLLAFQGLRVLNLSETSILKLPASLIQLTELRGLILRQCHVLVELPPLGGLTRLQILDCSHTDIVKLPPGMDKLTNLRQLDLSGTYSLQSIEPEIFSCLCSLEVLDMTNSAYKWAGIRKFNQLRRLNKLTIVYLQMEKLNIQAILSEYPFWIRRLKKFHFAVGDIDPRYAMSHTHDERRITVSNKDLSTMEYGCKVILQHASSWLLDNCTRIEKLSSSLTVFDVMTSLCIVNSTWVDPIERHILVYDLLPNLEELTLDWMRYLDSISDLGRPLRMRSSKLRVLRVSNCHRLKNLVCSDGFIPRLESLEEIVISNCNNLKELFVNCSSANATVPNLKTVKLNNLPKLQTLCGEQEALQQLEQLEVIKSDLLRKLPVTAESATRIKEIKGQSEWWNQLELDDELKTRLRTIFQSIDT